MKLNLKQEYPAADFDNIETLKQIAINKFQEYGFVITKTMTAKIKLDNGKPDGFFLYHNFATICYKNCQETIEETANKRVYRRYKKEYHSDWIASDSFDEFENMLEIIIQEAQIRRGDYDKSENRGAK